MGALALAFVMAAMPADARKRKADEPRIKYVFYMIADGMGLNSVYGAQLYNRSTGNGPENINFLQFPVRTIVTTHSASSLVTDSAAAGTALATGNKANDYTVGVDSEMSSVSNITEWAKAQGYGTGVATTVGINHATPAAFYAHSVSRNNYNEIIEDYIGSGLDFLAGGGIYTEKKGSLSAGDLEEMIAESGITVMRGSEMDGAAAVDARLLCMGAEKRGELKFAIDQDEDDTELSDFVTAGIEYLDRHFGEKGFLFMIEGGKIDYAHHGDDAVGGFHEINDFADAVDVVMDFYEEHPEETLIVVTSDHDTGGMILGAAGYKPKPGRLAWQKESEDALTGKFRKQFGEKAPSWDEVKAFLSENLGLWSNVDVDRSFEESLRASVEEMAKSGVDDGVENLYSVNSKIVYDAVVYLAKVAGFSWAGSSHSGSPVGLFVIGRGAEAFNACTDNTDIPKTIAKVAGYMNKNV